MKYRADIDGLRALAVASVIAFHFDRSLLPSGFLGVDVFFVISGFLITHITVGELAEDRFSLVQFYRRRVVRILPALLAMISLVVVAGVFLLPPRDLRLLGFNAAAAAMFVSNFYFWTGSGYFTDILPRPLLHSWSLGVEEQFYLFYPLFLLVVHRAAPGRFRLALWILTIASFVLSQIVGIDYPDTAFYMLPCRGWELGLGALAATGGIPAIGHARVKEVICAGGLAVLLLILSQTPFLALAIPPSLTIPLAPIATALLLAFAAGTRTAALLSVSPLRWLGLLSYSLYLWHFPVLALYKLAVDPFPSSTMLMILLALVIILALLSYFAVEQPMRRRFSRSGSARDIVQVGLLASVGVALLGTGIALATPILVPVSPEVAKIEQFLDYRQSDAFAYQHGPPYCFDHQVRYEAARCLKFSATRRNIIVYGDSHAAHIWRAIAERFPNDNVMMASSPACSPLLHGRGSRSCRAMRQAMMRALKAHGRVQAVVVAAKWSPVHAESLADTIRAIAASGARVTVIGPAVGYRLPEPALLARAFVRHDRTIIDRARDPIPGRIDPRFRAVSEAAGAQYYSLYQQECPAGKCRLLTRQNTPFHFDKSHLTIDGARTLVAALPEP